MTTVDRLAKRFEASENALECASWESVARWWLGALAEEAEADADSQMDAPFAALRARHAAAWLREMAR